MRLAHQQIPLRQAEFYDIEPEDIGNALSMLATSVDVISLWVFQPGFETGIDIRRPSLDSSGMFEILPIPLG